MKTIRDNVRRMHTTKWRKRNSTHHKNVRATEWLKQSRENERKERTGEKGGVHIQDGKRSREKKWDSHTNGPAMKIEDKRGEKKKWIEWRNAKYQNKFVLATTSENFSQTTLLHFLNSIDMCSWKLYMYCCMYCSVNVHDGILQNFCFFYFFSHAWSVSFSIGNICHTFCYHCYHILNWFSY